MPKIKGKDHLIKDEYTQAVINTDKDAYAMYKIVQPKKLNTFLTL